jgi:hypothetical protein
LSSSCAPTDHSQRGRKGGRGGGTHRIGDQQSGQYGAESLQVSEVEGGVDEGTVAIDELEEELLCDQSGLLVLLSRE